MTQQRFYACNYSRSPTPVTKSFSFSFSQRNICQPTENSSISENCICFLYLRGQLFHNFQYSILVFEAKLWVFPSACSICSRRNQFYLIEAQLLEKSVGVTQLFDVFIFQVDRVIVGSPPVLICAMNFLKFSYIYIEFLMRFAINGKRSQKSSEHCGKFGKENF